ncbi:MAG TPA: hypothetical protein VLC09_02730, partial [Polyangiaceae bacterium]|nr:hypothetical protein [Polyangiaceae bacterium]
GQRAEAERPLLELIEAERGAAWAKLSNAERAVGLRWIGEAASLLGAPADANDAFDDSEQLAPASPELLAARARLFLEKYDVAHAAEVVGEGLEKAPTDAELLVLSARVRLAQSLDFEAARDAVEAALVANPSSTDARAVLAGLALHDLDFARAELAISAGLATNPRHLELLSLRAATRFLAEDPEGFERQVDEILGLSPGYARLFSLVVEYAEWEHRYEDIERLLRRAARLDREDGRVRGELGLALVRSGSDASGIVELREAFRLDPYDVRVLNTLELFEQKVPRDYQEERHGPFQIRYPRAEHELLARYVPGLLDQAHARLVERYEYTPRAPLGIELYATREDFSVRTTGLPEAGLAGVCFGRKLATITPAGQAANLGMTLWHELAHVFHIGLSASRVPRWLTEGLAERETQLTGRGWRRELDVDLYRALREDALPHLATMNQAFTHARSMQAVGTAYYASQRLGDFIEETRGRDTLLRILRGLGEKRLAERVLPEVLGDPKQIDDEFRAWLRRDLARYESQFVSRAPSLPPELLMEPASRPGASERVRLDLALSLLASGRPDRALVWLEPLARGEFSQDVAHARGRAHWALGSHDEACQTWLEGSRSRTGFEFELVLARCAARREDWPEVRARAARAAELDGSQVEAWLFLAAAAQATGDRAAELEALEASAALSEHDGAVHRRLLSLLLGAADLRGKDKLHDGKALAAVAERALWAGLGNFETHRLVAEAWQRAGDRQRARFELASARLLITDDATRAVWQKTASTLGVSSSVGSSSTGQSSAAPR